MHRNPNTAVPSWTHCVRIGANDAAVRPAAALMATVAALVDESLVIGYSDLGWAAL